ncbi:hypothetical protein KZO01_17440 [Kurthia zopfii]|uniref:Uncharacterized protein conserved in bacteria n=1 Tax=Kurthia zopfii TaxID=1650 RepID=A0A8B4Q8U3_9BACL|nr:6-hydroxymethylpterin diphosphokinase MptE-like protein [Kurthia zopfii]TDR39249.1 hypothetical protein DFR61_11224 [Kurthia zopfii]GEK31435.1 hypothetical protein KZO01_17440 [Kurthia zopfii]STX08794.1 Uncharacterized protein conserved in bacteria [Kurthia zopfii]
MEQGKFIIEEFEAKDGNPILKINEYYIHSKYNPVREAEQVIAKKYSPHSLNIVFGYGSGHYIDELIKRNRYDEQIIVIDPLLGRDELKIKKEHDEIVKISSELISFLEDVLININSKVRTKFNVYCTKNYDKIFPGLYKELLQKIRDLQEANRVNDNTLMMFSEKWQKNLALNLNHMNRDASIENLKNMFELPIVIASSGPSLLKQLPLVKKWRKNIILLSSGSTTNVLLDNDISPDYIVTIDGGDANYNHFSNLLIKNATMIYSFQNHPKIRDSFEKQAIICNLLGHADVNKYVDEFIGEKIPSLLAGSTVANLSFSIAQYISSGPIAFIGQDLAFTDNLSHVKGHNHVKEIEVTNKDEFELVDGYYEGKIQTSTSMNSMRIAFERMIVVQPPSNEFFNCTEGGAKLKGYKQIPFKDFVRKYVVENEDEMIISNDLKFPVLMENSQVLKKHMQDLKNTKELIKIYKSSIKTIENDSTIEKFKNSTIKTLDANDMEISRLNKKLPISHILMPTILSVDTQYLEKENETEYQRFNRVKNQNIDFYKNGLLAVEKYLEIVQFAIKEKRDEINDSNRRSR